MMLKWGKPRRTCYRSTTDREVLLRSVALAVIVALALTGCTGTAQLVDALAKDPAANCISVSTPYGSINVARATPGVRVTLSAGSCSVDSTGSAALR